MDRNEKIVQAATLAVDVGSVAVFAALRMKARKHIWNIEVPAKNDPSAITSNN